jgi:hypothetical protein
MLPCGCWVQRGLATPRTLEDLGHTLKFAADLLPHHFDRVEVAHKCELVTELNPNGDSRSN